MDVRLLIEKLAIVERDSWVLLAEAILSNLKEKKILDKFVPEELVQYSDYNQLTDEQIQELTNHYLPLIVDAVNDVKQYRLLPQGIRDFLESSDEAMFYLGNKLLESVWARDRMDDIKSLRLDQIFDTPMKEGCHNCYVYALFKEIDQILSTPYGF